MTVVNCKLLQRIEVTLRSFYIFNSRFGKADGEEHKKICYYYPDDIEINTKIKDVGLSEAIIAFTSTFTENTNDCESLYTQKTMQVFYQPEKDFWMVLVLNVPKEIRSKDGIEFAEYRGGEVHDRIYRAVLEHCYNMFRLFHGTFQMNYAAAQEVNQSENFVDFARTELQKKLSTFYDKYLLTIKLPSCNFTDLSNSLQYLALDKHLFLNAHNFVNSVLATFPEISDSILMYKEHVVCGGKFHARDVYCLHKYMLDEDVLSRMPLEEICGSSGETVVSRSDSTISDFYRDGAYITCITQPNNELPPPSTSTPSLLKLYLNRENSLVPYYLTAYRVLDVTLCMFMNATNVIPEKNFYDRFQLHVKEKLIALSEDFTTSSSKSSQETQAQSTVPIASAAATNSSDGPKYIFINELSFKHLSNISFDRKRPQLALNNTSSNVLQLIADLDNRDMCSDEGSAFKETLVKTTNDFWIVRRSCNWRKYYVIIFNAKMSLLDVTTEAMRVFEQEIPDDVFFYK